MLARRRLLIVGAACGLFIFTILSFQSDKISNVPARKKENSRLYLNTPKEKEKSRKPNEEGHPKEFPLYDRIKQPEVEIEVNGHSVQFNKEEESKESSSLIRIHLVFHSHVDPGWLKTFEEYFAEKTKNIISNAVAALKKYPQLRFIWSETSFLERWWREATEEQKENMKSQVASGQLEISGGAWVMTDEATPTFYSAIENLIEGHSVIHELFGITPNTSWSVDPFGHGAMMPELLRLSGVDAMVIGRFHDHIKEKLRQEQKLRWRWTSPFSQTMDGPRVNSLPHLVYTTEDACPDHGVCMCYHVGPSALWQSRCADGNLLTKMNKQNVDFMTKRWVDEMRKVQEFYGTEDILVPIGDDFFFGDPDDFNLMFQGFAAMMEHLKQHPELNAQMKFSTVTEFFEATKNEKLPLLRGDFFPYTSNMKNPNPWWTGYFVHRPYSKTMERRLQNSLRSLDMVSVLREDGKYLKWKNLREAKRQLALFQHHDGITGTSTRLVMEDYEKRMGEAFDIFSEIFMDSVEVNKGFLAMNQKDNQLKKITIPEGKEVFLTVFSSQTFVSRHLIRVKTEKSALVFNEKGESVAVRNENGTSGNTLEFFADLKPMGITLFKLKNGESAPVKPKKCFSFGKNGQIKGIIVEGKENPLKIYVELAEDYGGAYVMDTRVGGWKTLSPEKRKEEETLIQRVTFSGYLEEKELEMTVSCVGDAELEVEMKTDIDIGNLLALSVENDIENDSFYTDVNGMYHLERKYQSKYEDFDLPVDSNVFPSATSSFIQDKKKRMTVFAGQPTGVTSTKAGRMTILVDRKVINDDGKGLGYEEGFDNRSSIVKFRILLENRLDVPLDLLSPFHSLCGYRSSSSLLYPPIIAVSSSPSLPSLSAPPSLWPCGVQLVSWRPLKESIAVLVLRRIIFEESIPSKCASNNPDTLFTYFSARYKSFFHSKLSATMDGEIVTRESFSNSLRQPFSIAAFRLHF